MSKKRAQKRKALQRDPKQRTVRVTLPGGRVVTHPDDGRSYAEGTMIQWNDRWTIVGCAWPFDD